MPTLDELPNDVDKLKELVLQQAYQLQTQKKLYNAKIDELKRQLFGRKSEKLSKEELEQAHLFNELEESLQEAPSLYDSHSDKIEVKGHSRKKSGRKPIPEDLPRDEIIHDLTEDEKICACGHELVRIGEEVSEKVDIVPQKVFVQKHIRYKYACKKCEGDSVEEAGNIVRTAPLPPQLIPQSIATPGLLAYLINAKFVNHLPFYRMEKIFLNMGLELSRSTMCNWAQQVYERCKPLIPVLKKHLLSGPLIGIDETTLQVLKEENRLNTTKSYMWLLRGGPPNQIATLYLYRLTRSAEFLEKYLHGYQGCIQTDGWKSYSTHLSKLDVIHAGCWAHVRRKFYEIWNSTENQTAGYILSFIQEMYKVEKIIRKKRMYENSEFDKIVELRHEKSKWRASHIKTIIDKFAPETPPQTDLGKAFTYVLNQWDELIQFLDHGEILIDNNLVENKIRPFVLGRKNWLFSGSPAGAEASAFLFSLIETAKSNHKEPYQFLRNLFEGLPYCSAPADYERLLLSELGWS